MEHCQTWIQGRGPTSWILSLSRAVSSASPRIIEGLVQLSSTVNSSADLKRPLSLFSCLITSFRRRSLYAHISRFPTSTLATLPSDFTFIPFRVSRILRFEACHLVIETRGNQASRRQSDKGKRAMPRYFLLARPTSDCAATALEKLKIRTRSRVKTATLFMFGLRWHHLFMYR